MEMREALRDRLLDAGGVSALVGTRVSWVTRPQASALPAITLQVISGEHPQHLEGFEKEETRVQLDAWAASTAAASAIVKAAKAALAPGVVHEGVQFGRMFFEQERDGVERLGNVDVYRVGIDLIFKHKAA